VSSRFRTRPTGRCPYAIVALEPRSPEETITVFRAETLVGGFPSSGSEKACARY
jgi:hypothetical protein